MRKKNNPTARAWPIFSRAFKKELADRGLAIAVNGESEAKLQAHLRVQLSYAMEEAAIAAAEAGDVMGPRWGRAAWRCELISAGRKAAEWAIANGMTVPFAIDALSLEPANRNRKGGRNAM